jgi:hypothetical protein
MEGDTGPMLSAQAISIPRSLREKAGHLNGRLELV